MKFPSSTIVVPVSFEPDDPSRLQLDRTMEVRQQDWVVVTDTTIQAIQAAKELLKPGGELHLVHATLDFTPRLSALKLRDLILLPSAQQLHAASPGKASRLLERVVERFCNGVDTSLHVGSGDPAEVVLKRVAEVVADAIVVANRKPTGRMNPKTGTVQSLIDRAPCPVVVIPC